MSDSSSPRRSVRPSVDGVIVNRSPHRGEVMRTARTYARRLSTITVAKKVLKTVAPLPPTKEAPVGVQPNKRRLIRIDMSLPADRTAHKHSKKPFKKSGGRFFKHWAFKTAASVCVLALMISGGLAFKAYGNANKVFEGGHTAAALTADVDPNLLKGEGDGRINMLVLGKGGPGHDGPDLTDTLLIFSVDPVNNTAALLSIPRDLWVQVAGYWQMKINSAYPNAKYKLIADGSNAKQAHKAGVASIRQTIEGVLGIPIHYYSMVDFAAFRGAVDTVKGVTVNVPTNLYDPTMAWENNWNPVLAKKGVQKFDGKRALMYVRSRETSSDFARAERQRQVIVALEQKIFSIGTFTNPIKVAHLMDEFGSHASTDMSLSDAMRLFAIMKRIDTKKIESIGLTTPPHNFLTTGRVGNQSVVRPIAGLSNYSTIQAYVRSALRDGYIVKEKAKIVVVNGTNQAGLASKEAKLLQSYGYSIVDTKEVPGLTLHENRVVALCGNGKKYTAHYLERRFKVTKTTQLPAGLQVSDADFVIILGK